MRHVLVLGGLLLILPIAGCHGDLRPYAPYSKTDPNTLRGECERAAYDDPVVKDTLAKAAGTGSIQEYWAQKVKDARYVAVQRCMLQRGGPDSGGGVQLPTH
jgi:hypothetical protein